MLMMQPVWFFYRRSPLWGGLAAKTGDLCSDLGTTRRALKQLPSKYLVGAYSSGFIDISIYASLTILANFWRQGCNEGLLTDHFLCKK